MDDDEKKELISVINSGWFTEASKTRQFEKMFADFVGVKYACAVTSGTTALYVGLKALGIGSGDEVIIPDLTFVASPNSVEAVGAKPVLIDIEQNSLNLDLKKIKQSITKRTKAIMPVDFNGRPLDIKKISEMANRYNLSLIEDAAHGLGCFYGNNKKLYEKCKALKDFGRKSDAKRNMRMAFEHPTIGYNFKFTEFQAAVGIAQMRKLRKRMITKKKMFRIYEELLSKLSSVNFIKTDLDRVTPWMVDVLVDSKKKRDGIIRHLEKNQVETRIFYPPIHRLSPYKDKDAKFKMTSEISDRGIWLPSSVTLKEKDVEYICRKIISFSKKNSF